VVAVCFAALLRVLGVVTVATKAIQTARHTAALMKDPGLTDLQKEHAARAASLALMGGFASIAARAAVATAASAAVLATFDLTALAGWTAVMELFTAWQGIALTSIIMTLVYSIKVGR
jgi:hypothetical protein